MSTSERRQIEHNQQTANDSTVRGPNSLNNLRYDRATNTLFRSGEIETTTNKT